MDGIDRTASSQPVINAPDASLRVIEHTEYSVERGYSKERRENCTKCRVSMYRISYMTHLTSITTRPPPVLSLASPTR